ncbi:non-specific lipid-transfer protein 1-like [Mercurialis annua]|uniref:non-specific lipid-transfer protein 1-like n=1 Tax=Mercurialis annua TaxID=3986 RepID=UPI0024AF0218|nr:non-specific lipid-transfer protein 1-like [Mercurialis annua]
MAENKSETEMGKRRKKIALASGYSALLIRALQGSQRISFDCCRWLYNIISASKTTSDQQTACSCFKRLMTLVPLFNVDRAESLPESCGFYLPYKISPATKCDSVSERKMYNDNLLALRAE